MKLTRSTASLLLACGAAWGISSLCCASTKVTALELKPGQYAMTVTYQVQGERQNQSRDGTRCIKATDLKNPEAIFSDQIAASQEEANCSVRELKAAGGKVSYDADCSNRTVHIVGSLNETEFSVVRTVRPKASPKILLKFVVTGKRTGDCTGAAAAGFEKNAFTSVIAFPALMLNSKL